MPFRQNTIFSANPARDLILEVEPDLISAGWSFVEEVVITTVTHRVYRSNAASNSRGLDFYVSFSWTTTGGATLSWRAFEVWDTGTKRMDKIVVSSAFATTPTPGVDFSATTGTQLLSYTGAYQPGMSLTTAGYNYWSSVTADRIVIGSRYANTDQAHYAGLYESFMQTFDDPFPLVLMPLQPGIGANGSSYGGSSREPKTTTPTTYGFWTYMKGPTDQNGTWTRGSGNEVYSNRPVPSRVIVFGARNADNAFRGLLRDVISCQVTAITQVNGDLLVFDVPGATPTAVTWVRVGHGAGASYDFFIPMDV